MSTRPTTALSGFDLLHYALAVIFSLGCVPAHAETAATAETAPKLPAVVAAGLKSVAEMCREVGGTPMTDKAVTRVDLTGDGKEDYVLDIASVNCDGAAGVYGDREKGVTVYVGDGVGGASEAFSESVFGVKIEGTAPAAKLWLTVVGQQCGRKPAANFATESFCERALVWNAKNRKFEYAPVSTVRMIQ